MVTLRVRMVPRISAQIWALIGVAVLVLLPAGPVAADGGDSPGSAQVPVTVDDPAVATGLAWHLQSSGVRTAWRSSLGQGITVAVVDSGVDAGHPDLAGQVTASVSCLDTGGDPGRCRGTAGDANGHGTHVAGLIAAQGNNGIGVVGVAPGAHLLAVRALRSSCGTACEPSGSTADIAAGVRWSLEHGADIINLSIAGNRRLGPDLTAAIDAAWQAGAITVLAAGQRDGGAVYFDSKRALVVTATDRDGMLARYAPALRTVPFGIAAPGGALGDTAETCHVGGRPLGILSTVARGTGDGSGYACIAGTSMAAAQVSGGLALLRSMGFTRDQALERVLDTARPGVGMGSGSLDLAAAVGGPLPVGVHRRSPDFGTVQAAGAAQPITTGPFTNGTVVWVRRRPPAWLIMVVGGLGAGVIADLWMRHQQRRRAADDAAVRPGVASGG